MFSLLRKRESSRGLLGYLGLVDWWERSLSDAERARILERYRPLGATESSLTEGHILSTSQSALHFLSGLASWFKAPEDYEIAKKIFAKGAEFVATADVVDIHFFLQAKIDVFYRNREFIPAARDLAIAACRDQIAISPKVAAAFLTGQGPVLPAHKGFNQLAIILEKDGRIDDVVELCRTAQGEGWAGDWESRIDRVLRKLKSS